MLLILSIRNNLPNKSICWYVAMIYAVDPHFFLPPSLLCVIDFLTDLLGFNNLVEKGTQSNTLANKVKNLQQMK